MDGAELADLFGDKESAEKDRNAAQLLERAINSHWISPGYKTPEGTFSTGQIWDTFDRVAGLDYKNTGLDVAEVLAALHAHNELDSKGNRFFSPSDPRVLKTAYDLSRAFQNEYPIARANPEQKNLGVPIGRYPKDRYNGLDANYAGNPWYLATAAFAELYYRCAKEWQEAGRIEVVSTNYEFISSLTSEKLSIGVPITPDDKRFGLLIGAIHDLGDSYLRRIKFHAGPDGHLNEEFSRDNGTPQGAENLSWSYASVLSAAQFR